jgi:hypothetical protein
MPNDPVTGVAGLVPPFVWLLMLALVLIAASNWH